MEKNRDRLIDRWKFLEPFKPHWGLNSGAGSMRDVYVMAPVGRPHLGVPNGTRDGFPEAQRGTQLVVGVSSYISDWWYTCPSEKYESQLGWLFPIYGKIKNVLNHQPDILWISIEFMRRCVCLSILSPISEFFTTEFWKWISKTNEGTTVWIFSWNMTAILDLAAAWPSKMMSHPIL